MNDNYNGTLGDAIFAGIEKNEYLNELYEAILFNYSVSLFHVTDVSRKEIDIEDSLRFADILSKSTSLKKADMHKTWAQEIVALLKELYPNDRRIKYCMGSVLSSTGNYYGMSKVTPDYCDLSLFDEMFTYFSKDYMKIPAMPKMQFMQSQKAVYDRLGDTYFSYSAPTSMGKSFVMRMFLKKKVMDGEQLNFVLLVPTKALINEVTSKVISDLKEWLAKKSYRVITSAGAMNLEQNKNHNYIFILTPERLLYLLIDNKKLHIDYLFIDEAHKISSKDDRSTFYFDVVSMLCQQTPKPHIAFASPNIPNPEEYLKLVPDAEFLAEHKISSGFSPVSQIKYLVDLVSRDIRLYNPYKKDFSYISCLNEQSLSEIIRKVSKPASQNIIYCSSTAQAVDNARDFTDNMPELNDTELNTLSKDIQNEVNGAYYLVNLIKKGVAYHIGYLPATIRMRIEELFEKGKIRTIFCTSTLVEGVNLPADNLFITSYKNGRSIMEPVDFRNLTGRVGRIDYGLYGNVFLVRMSEKIKAEKFEKLLQENVSMQKLSLVAELTKPQKELIVECLKAGKVELLKYPKNQTADNYSLMRKFALILLRDITKDWKTAVRNEFAPFLKKGDEDIIRQAFGNKIRKPDDDINISVDQTENLYKAIKSGLHYPPIQPGGIVNYDELMEFLEKLCNIFKWEKYEPQTLGKLSSTGGHALLKWYAVILVQWISGAGLSNIINRAIQYKEDTPESGVMINGKIEKYDGTDAHKNIVISDTLKVIENTILFSISNYFLRFSNEYKIQHPNEIFQDWYEYVEYGTTNPLTITLQRSGFSREASTYIRQHRTDYVTGTNEQPKLRKTLLKCSNISIRKETVDILYNMPELFVD